MRETRSTEVGTRNRWARFGSAFPLPRSALSVEHRGLVCGSRRCKSEMPVRGPRGAPAAGRAGEEALLHEERLVHLPERAPVLGPRGSGGREGPPPAPPLLADGLPD